MILPLTFDRSLGLSLVDSNKLIPINLLIMQLSKDLGLDFEVGLSAIELIFSDFALEL